MNFAVADDGSFTFQTTNSKGGLDTIALLSRPGQEPLLAAGSQSSAKEYATTFEDFERLARKRGLAAAAAAEAVG